MENYVLVIGLGESGVGATRLLLHLGYKVIGVDRTLCGKEKLGIPLLLDSDSLPYFPFQLAILSPGISKKHSFCVQVEERGIELIGEAELACRFLSNLSIAVTGTNGKSTLTRFLAHLLQQEGKKALALGNIGKSLAEYALYARKEEIVVAELSSFQLETMKTPFFRYGIITSITPDHLDRYCSFEEYAYVKCQLGKLLLPGGKLFVSEAVAEAYGDIFLSSFPIETVTPLSCLQLTSKKGYWKKLDPEKIAFADAIARHFSLGPLAVEKALKSFTALPHRLEYVGEIEGVSFYNDSKATNVEAVLFAIKQLDRPIILIAGGLDKGSNFTDWNIPFGTKVKKIIAIGKASSLIESACGGHIEVIKRETLESAVSLAFCMAKVGDIVLLSPGCASFDQFIDYRERGEVFKRTVSTLRRKR